MNRRNFFQAVTAFVAGLFAIKAAPDVAEKAPSVPVEPQSLTFTTGGSTDQTFTHRIYIDCNGKITEIKNDPYGSLGMWNGKWVHVVREIDNDILKLKVYVDGELID